MKPNHNIEQDKLLYLLMYFPGESDTHPAAETLC